jgi:hypothetical protein
VHYRRASKSLLPGVEKLGAALYLARRMEKKDSCFHRYHFLLLSSG